ncbi:MAG: hypothetical protein V4490_03570 [Pseudomonadota bacterium]
MDLFQQSSSFDFTNMIANLMSAVYSIQNLVVAISYLMGVSLIARAIFLYKTFGQQVTQASRPGELAAPIVQMFVGAMLIYLPNTLDTSLNTLYGGGMDSIANASSLIGYNTISTFGNWSQLSNVIVHYMQLIGLISFVRGWILLSKLGHAGEQPGNFSKGLTHIIGGILLINVVDTINILATTFGFQ